MSVINIKIVAIKRKHTFSFFFFFFPNLCLYVDSQICGNALRFLWVEEIKELQKKKKKTNELKLTNPTAWLLVHLQVAKLIGFSYY